MEIKSFIKAALLLLGMRILYKAKSEADNQEKYFKKTLKSKKYQVLFKQDLLFKAAEIISLLEEKFLNFNIEESASETLIVSFADFKFHIDSWEEFFILKEIFIDEEYKFLSPFELIFVDIGTNVGISSLYFSRFKNTKGIYCFEPVKDTFEIAQKNFEINSNLKILGLYNFGLGAFEREEYFLFNREFKGNSGIRGKLSSSLKNQKNNEHRQVTIKPASVVLEPIFKRHKGDKIVLKIDCEGGEYEIIEDLARGNLLKHIYFLMIEWHDHGPNILEDYLLQNNFLIISKTLSNQSGLIYAMWSGKSFEK